MSPSVRTDGLAEDEGGADEVRFFVGNTYEEIPHLDAESNRHGTNPKIHDWSLYVDVFEGDPSIIHYVKFDLPQSFQPSSFTCYSPVRTILPDSSLVLRFKTRQQSAKGLTATISIVGSGGTISKIKHKLVLSGNGMREDMPRVFTEMRPIRPLPIVPLPKDDYFAIELDLVCTEVSKRVELASVLQDQTGHCVSIVEEKTIPGARTFDTWKIIHDGSLDWPEDPDGNHTWLVSPMLCGSEGIEQCRSIFHAIERVEWTSMNKASKYMGFRVHIDASGFHLDTLIKICQNFIKYEEAMDTIMPPPHQMELKKQILSNKNCLGKVSNLRKHRALSACASTECLADLMNPRGMCYKLNLQNLKTIDASHRPTLEFRQHCATNNFEKAHAWIAFCMAFVHNSARFKAPSALHKSRNLDDQFDFLFEYVVKDRALEQIYRRRRKEVTETSEEEHNIEECERAEVSNSEHLWEEEQ